MSTQKNRKKTALNSITKPIPDTLVTANTINTNEHLQVLKEEILVWIFSIVCSLLVYIVVARLILSVYHPDINSLIEAANKLLIEPGGVRPEPMEAMLFRSGIIIIIPCLLGFYMLFSKLKLIKGLAQTPFFLFFSTFCIVLIAALAYVDFAAPNPFAKGGPDVPQNSRDFTAMTNFDYYFDGFFLGSYFLLYTFIIVPIMACLFFIGMKKYNWENNKLFNRISSVTGYVILGGVVIACVLMSVFYFPYSFENKYDFNAVYYAMTQTYSGLPMLVGGFTDTYGLYPQFLNLVFFFTGLSVFKFSLVMGLLIGLAFAANFYSLKQFISNKAILFLGMFTVIFIPFLDPKLGQNFDCIFAFFPIRYIIPSTLIFLAALYLKKRSQLVYWITFVVMAFFVLWNPEIGMVCYLSWLAVNTFNDFYNQEGKAGFKKILFHWLAGAGVIITVFYTYKVLIWLFYGSAPDLALLFGTVLVFGKVGFGLLPMTLVHPWNIVVLILVLGFTYSISKWYKKEVTPKAAMVFLISVISVGFFAYFQGRSHNWVLAQSSCFCMMLLAILGDELWKSVKNNNVLSLNVLFILFLFASSFSLFEIIYDREKINEFVYQEDDKTRQAQEQQRIESNTDFIIKNSQPGEKIHVMTARQYQGLYFDGNKRRSAFNPGLEDFFLITDLNRLTDIINDSSFTIFIEPGLCNYYFMSKPFAAMAASYELRGANQTMALLKKRAASLPAKKFFEHAGAPVFYRKYDSSITSVKLRAADALGANAVNLNPEFSVEVLFNTKTQIYPYATVAGNMNDSCGFIIANIINSPNYFFGINGKGIGFPLPNNEWVYCVMNVFPDHLDVYTNGNLAGTMPLAHPIRTSPEKLSVGNNGFLRYYLGAISEVAVNNTALDKAGILQTWEEIKQVTGK